MGRPPSRHKSNNNYDKNINNRSSGSSNNNNKNNININNDDHHHHHHHHYRRSSSNTNNSCCSNSESTQCGPASRGERQRVRSRGRRRRRLSDVLLATFCLSVCALAEGAAAVDLHIAGFFPTTYNLSEGAIGRGVVPAVNLALEHINNATQFLPGYTLAIQWNDTQVGGASTQTKACMLVLTG